MAISRLQASLAQVTNEVTLAAANINFDFTLVKIEAPKEYQALGETLSKNRKDEAEMGTTHITAQRLGALFQGVCPSTPKLVKAYGCRVSEIAEAAKKKSASESSKNGMFAAHSGVDGTSIWAAATSSTTALHVQLLACMLARLWNAQEATSAWVELVKERRKDIAKRFDDEESLPFALLTASVQSEIPRSQLADWDASARSWLRTADNVKAKEQQQLMLILANINVPVNKDMKVLSSVISAWTTALGSMENLIGGMPQAVNSGPTLLALSAWHLYPDLLVADKASEIQMCDPLVNTGGILTVGLEQAGDEDKRGVYWSLSLAHLRHYGAPVETERRLNYDSARVTFFQFAQAVFGCLLGAWGVTYHDLELTIQFFVNLGVACEKELEKDAGQPSASLVQEFFKDSCHWLHYLISAAVTYYDTADKDHDLSTKLIRMGIRKSQSFFSERIQDNSFFGLWDWEDMMHCLKGPEERIDLLRRIAFRIEGRSTIAQHFIIRYTRYDEHLKTSCVEYATAIPHPSGPKRKRDIGEDELPRYTSCHRRWLLDAHYSSVLSNETWELIRQNEFTMDFDNIVTHQQATDVSDKFNFLLGDPNSACIYKASSDLSSYATGLSIEDLIWCLERRMFSFPHLLRQIEQSRHSTTHERCTMMALSIVAKIYTLLPDATISIDVLNRPIQNTFWLKNMSEAPKTYGNESIYLHDAASSKKPRTFRQEELTKPEALACVTYLESGNCDLDPFLLNDVMALSSGDSLYISMQLLCDPYVTPQPYELKRILGNIGKAGITMLIPPQNPMISKRNESCWKIINDGAFDGLEEDHFSKTTMHLSFTDFNVPHFDGARGGHDSQIHFLESVISVHDSGVWVGDVDVLKALENIRLARMQPMRCRCKKTGKPTRALVSVESWNEILDPPNEPIVIRAAGNWISRLAVTAILMQTRPQGENYLESLITICPAGICWACNDPNPAKRNPYALHQTYSYSPKSMRAYVY